MPDGPKLETLIPIRKMDPALTFYTKALRAPVTDRATGAMKNSWAAGKVCGAEVWFTGVEKWEKRSLAYQTFVVKDIRRFVAKLKRAGVAFEKAERMSKETKIDGPMAFDVYGASAFFKDSEGNLLMVWQAPRSM